MGPESSSSLDPAGPIASYLRGSHEGLLLQACPLGDPLAASGGLASFLSRSGSHFTTHPIPQPVFSGDTS